MKKTIKTLALITVTVAAVKAFGRVNKGKCIYCGGLSELKINNEDFICDTCAQIQSELSEN